MKLEKALLIFVGVSLLLFIVSVVLSLGFSAPPPPRSNPYDMVYCGQRATYEDCINAIPPKNSGKCTPMQEAVGWAEPTIATSAEDFDYCTCILTKQEGIDFFSLLFWVWICAVLISIVLLAVFKSQGIKQKLNF